ncbi:MAG TPA: imelysin family protein, partial [Flavobacteriaceae bacterium]|nr:imelysin family protein [Flavobacteriaceae bacterium]
LHEKWVESYKKWQYIEMFNIGKAEEIMFYNKVNTYPASTDRINNNIDENKTDLSNPNDWSAQGFPGIDYMIHGIESTKQAIVDKYNNESKYGIYLKTLVNDMSTNTNIVIDDWGTYKASFISSVDNTATSAFNMLTNDFVFYFEKGLRTNKIGIPAGRFSTSPLPDRVEAYYSSKNSFEDISKILALESRKAAEDLFLGRSSSGDLGASYKSYLDYLETDLGATLISKLEAAETALNELEDNFISQINSDNNKMLLAFDALQTIVVNFKTDMLSNFNIAVDYVDADGD